MFLWCGNGISTEHTAWLNLKRGIPAPLSGAVETNGQAVAEQIGAQTFIDGWAMLHLETHLWLLSLQPLQIL